MKQVDDMPAHAIQIMRVAQEVMSECFGMDKAECAKIYTKAYFEQSEQKKEGL